MLLAPGVSLRFLENYVSRGCKHGGQKLLLRAPRVKPRRQAAAGEIDAIVIAYRAFSWWKLKTGPGPSISLQPQGR